MRKPILADTGAILAKGHFIVLILAVSTLACGGTYLVTPTVSTDLYPSPSSEARVRVITTTPLPAQSTATPIVVVQMSHTATPVPPSVTEVENEINWLCVTAQEAVYLRPSPNAQNYPIMELSNGTRVELEGGEDGSWLFVSISDKRGWVNRKYLSACE